MRKKHTSAKVLKFDEQDYQRFLETIKRISTYVKTKIPNKLDLEAVFEDKKLIKEYQSAQYQSKPEEFAKENILSELLDFLGYDKNSRTAESELKRGYGIKWPDYKLVIDDDFYLLVEAEPLNSDLYEKGHGLNQVIEWLQTKGTTDYGVATDGLHWIMINYSPEYRRHMEVINLDLSPFIIEALGLKEGIIDQPQKKKLFSEFMGFFSKELILSTLTKKNVELENYQENISGRFYKEYMKLVFGERASATSLVSSITDVSDLEAQKRIAQAIIDRLIFIKFIEARGWLNGDKNFLSNLLKSYNKNPTGTFYNSLLKVLFFNILNNPDDSQKKGNFAGIKYLNGGLFSKIRDEEANPDYSVTDDILFKIIKFLETYRFEGKTITKLEESSTEENIMSPEILGYIFERTANHDHGAFYTPENVTTFIAQGTVYEYIMDLINAKLRERGIYPIKKLESLSEEEEIKKEDLKELYENIKSIRILDPACGSGAFFMPVIGLLMRVHLIFANRLGITLEPYKVKKQIIENNIFGAEINQEAVEIAKLRLWLELVSTAESIDEIDLLPNIDYNIISGNSLFGLDTQTKANGIPAHIPLDIADFVDILSANYKTATDRINELNEKPTVENTLKMKDILLRIYKGEHDPKAATLVKKIISKIDLKLRSNLNKSYSSYLKQPFDLEITEEEISNEHPIHWMLEFHEVMNDGGFDIVLGNPPYIEMSKVNYPLKQYSTLKCGNLYAPFFERAIKLTKKNGYFGYIVPISSICTDRMTSLQDLLIKNTDRLKISNYDDRPDKIFKVIEHCRSSIIFGHKNSDGKHVVFSTHYHRWHAEDRDFLFKKMKYLEVTDLIKPGIIPKLGDKLEETVIKKMENDKPLSNFIGSESDNRIIYHNAPQYWIRAMDFMPEFKNSKGSTLSPHNKTFYVSDKNYLKSIISTLNSSLFYWFFIVNSNCRDLTDREIQTFNFDPSSLRSSERKQLEVLCDKLMEDYKEKSKLKKTEYEATGEVVYREFYPKLSKPIIDRIDNVIFDHYGFTMQEKDYIRNFDLKFRMGDN